MNTPLKIAVCEDYGIAGYDLTVHYIVKPVTEADFFKRDEEMPKADGALWQNQELSAGSAEAVPAVSQGRAAGNAAVMKGIGKKAPEITGRMGLREKAVIYNSIFLLYPCQSPLLK